MSKELFTIDPRIWSLNDPRIASLEKKEITQSQFMQLIKQDDPFEMRAGNLTYIPEEETAKRLEDYKASVAGRLKLTGGLSGSLVLDNKKAFVSVYPELQAPIEDVQNTIDKENCKGCARNKYTQRLLDELALMPKDRDITPLEPLIAKYSYAKSWLTGASFEVDISQIQIPPMFVKKQIPLRTTPLASVMESEYTPDRKQCIDCAKKHVAQALVLLREAEKGYPDHVELAYQHLQKAEKNVPEDRKLAFIKLMNILQDELRVLDLKTIHNITETRKLIEEYLKDPSDPSAIKIWMAIGHLAEAEDEAVNDYPELTRDIRNERLELMRDTKYSPALEFLLRKAVNTPPKVE